jgi:hypothetical protein
VNHVSLGYERKKKGKEDTYLRQTLA